MGAVEVGWGGGGDRAAPARKSEGEQMACVRAGVCLEWGKSYIFFCWHRLARKQKGSVQPFFDDRLRILHVGLHKGRCLLVLQHLLLLRRLLVLLLLVVVLRSL
eukprot:Rhum_TRINITY_DN14082_c4_g1::Rhum_TRINITY_DN14082_c4_g1_i1::g.67100::m.67100